MALLGVLSLLGVSVAIHSGAWAAAVTLFAVLSVAFFGMSHRRQRSLVPLALAATGAAIIAWVMFVSYDRAVEIIGFSFLVAAGFVGTVINRRRVATERSYDAKGLPSPGHN